MVSVDELPTYIEAFLKERPDIARALEIFRISAEEYRRAFIGPKTSTTNTTNYPEGT